MQRKYSTKFKIHTIEKVLQRSEHQTIADIAMITGVNLFTLKEWLKLYRRKNTPKGKFKQTTRKSHRILRTESLA